MIEKRPLVQQARKRWIPTVFLVAGLGFLTMLVWWFAPWKKDESPTRSAPDLKALASEETTAIHWTAKTRAAKSTTPSAVISIESNHAKDTPGSFTTQESSPLEKILLSPEPEEVKASRLLALIPSLPESELADTAQHLVNILADEDFSMATSLLTNVHTPTNVLDILVSDLLNRPNSVKLPMLFEVMQHSNHPKETEAREILLHFLETDLGADWDRWKTALRSWLDSHPD
jgi:hypothetical protein